MKDRKDDFVVSDAMTWSRPFPLKDLLTLNYFLRYRDDTTAVAKKVGRYHRGIIVTSCSTSARSTTTGKRTQERLRRRCAVVRLTCRTAMQHLLRSSSIRYNIRLVHEGIIKSLRLGRQECDVIVERLDGSSAYLAVRFNLPLATTDAEPRSLPWKKPMNPFITDDECGRV